MPKIVPEMFNITSDEDGGDGSEIPDAVEPGPSTAPAISREPAAEQAPDFQGPTSTEWRCLQGDGDCWEMNLYGTWLCCGCESTEFYSCRRPLRHQTDEGVWMFPVTWPERTSSR